jgi:hypothetical protein
VTSKTNSRASDAPRSKTASGATVAPESIPTRGSGASVEHVSQLAKTATMQRVDALEAVVASLRTIKNPSTRLHRQLAKTRRRLHVWRRKLAGRAPISTHFGAAP